MNKREAKLLDELYLTWVKRADLYKQLADNFKVNGEDTATSEGYRVMQVTTDVHVTELMAFINDITRLEADNGKANG